MQQINLYLEEFKHKKRPYSAQTIMVAMLAGFALSVIASVGIWMTNYKMKSQIEGQREKVEAAENYLKEVAKDYPAPIIDSRLERTVEAMSERKDRNQRLLGYLSKHNLSIHRQSFSRILEALYGISEKGLWLTSIIIRDGGTSITLQGLMQKPDSLPKYLKKLGQEAAFQGMQFSVFDLNRQAENIAFKVSSERKEEANDLLHEVFSTSNQ